MKGKALLLCAFLCVAVFAQAQAPKASGGDEASLRAADQAWLKAFQSKDMAKTAAFVGPGGAMLPPNGPIAANQADIQKLLTGLSSMQNLKFSWTPTIVSVAKSGDLGFTSGTYEMSFTDNGKPGHDKGKYVTVWKKQGDGSWKVVRDIFNSDMPAGH